MNKEFDKTKTMVDKEIFVCANFIANALLENHAELLENEYPLLENGEEDYDNPRVVMQWFLVSEWLGRKLLAKKEAMIVTDDNVFIWGRTEYGNPLYCDLVIQEIAEENM